MKNLFVFVSLIALTGASVSAFYFFITHPRQMVENQPAALHQDRMASDSMAEQESLTGGMIAPIENQLKALKRNDIFEAYDTPSSSDFLDTVSFEDFKALVLKNPLLTQFDDYTYRKHIKAGEQGNVIVSLNPEMEPLTLEYQVKNEGEEGWKIQYMQVLSDASTKASGQQLGADKLIQTIKDVLKRLKEKEYEKVYDDFIASRIKKNTPEEKFESFFNSIPAFSTYQTMNIKEPYIENSLGLVGVDLINEEGTTAVEFSLQEEDHAWKITGIHVEKGVEPAAPEQNTPPGFKSRDLITVLQSFLDSLQRGDITSAYKNFTTDWYQEANSLDQFKEFIQRHPELGKGTSSTFDKIAFNNNIATITGKLFLSNSLYLPVEFDLLQEDGKWKILHIFTYPVAHLPTTSQENTSTSNSMTIGKIVMGTRVNSEGDILNSTSKLTLPVDDIYVNIYIQNGAPGNTVTAVLRHITSGSEIAPITVPVTEKGNSRITLVFSPPSKGWPQGSYQIRVSLSNSEYKTFSFTISD